MAVLEATRAAIKYTHYGIVTAFPLGKGNGPLNHMHNILERKLPLCVLVNFILRYRSFLSDLIPLPRPCPSNPYPFVSAMINGSYDSWLRYVKHPFVRSLGAGTLPKENFVHFLKSALNPLSKAIV